MNLSPSRFLLPLASLFLVAVCSAAVAAETPARQTGISIVADQFFINGQPTYPKRIWRGQRIEGLLLNSRMVQGIYDDLNPETATRWAYPDTGKWDAERNTREFVAAMPEWKAHGLLAFTLCLQGGSPQGYSQEQPWINSAFAPEGSLRPEYLARLTRILDEADRLGMVVILGYFYFGQDERVTDEAGVLRAVDHATRWVLEHGYTNVLIEVNNECDVKSYDHAILKPDRVSELITRVRGITHEGRRLLVGASFTGGKVPADKVIAASDFVLLHGNGANDPERIRKMVRETRARPAWRTMPVIVNEDDHFDFKKPDNHFAAAVEMNASWGYFDPGKSDYRDGYQCPPVNWGLNTPRKQSFFELVAEIAGVKATPSAAAPVAAPAAPVNDPLHWAAVAAQGQPQAREECSFVECAGRFYLLGGRGIKPVEVFDPSTRTWTHGAPPPIEVHHFQAVVWERRIVIAGAMTGVYPRETPVDRLLFYDPKTDTWTWGAEIPTERRRGSAGAVVREGKLHLICGITNGHTDGWVKRCDTFVFKTGQWETLPDAPQARDHFEAAIADGKIYAVGGRRSSAITGQVFDLTIPEVDVLDLATKTWATLPLASNLPIPRAGTATLARDGEIIVFGGESMAQTPAHAEIDALDTHTGRWRKLPPLLQGRHGTSVIFYENAYYTCAGAGARGGRPLLDSTEMLKLPFVPVPAPNVPPRTGETERFDYTQAQTLEGWDADPTYWTVKDGVFTAKGEKVPSNFLLTKKNYADFRLTLWSQVVESDNHAGVALWGEQTVEGNGFNKWAYKGPLVIFPGLGLWDYRTKKGISVDPEGKAVAKKFAGQHDWIQVEILAQGNRVRVAYNGHPVLDWREPDPSLLKDGPIGLQLHGFTPPQEVIYKDVVIETFPKEDRLITVQE